MLHVQSIRYADEVPIVFLDQYYPYELCAFLADVPLDDPDLTSESILSEHGIELVRADGEIIAPRRRSSRRNTSTSSSGRH